MWSGAMFRQALARGATVCVRWSWKLESSTASTSAAPSSAIVLIAVPTFPTAAARRPAAVRMEASMPTVVVLPFVPVRVSHGRREGGTHCTRQASSTSLQQGMPACWARSRSGRSGRRPGEATTMSGRPIGPSSAATANASPSGSARRSTPSGRSADSTAAGSPSTASTWAPTAWSTRAAATPDVPRPATTTRAPSSASRSRALIPRPTRRRRPRARARRTGPR